MAVRKLVALALSVGVIVGGALTQESDTDCFRRLVNAERTSRGIPALKNHQTMNTLAQNQAVAMREADTIFHNRNLAQQAPPFLAIGENVGMGPSCQAIHDAYMDSPGHRANILDRDYTHLGVGVATKQDPDSSTGRWLYNALVFFRPAATPKPPPPAETPKPRPRCTCPR